MRPGSRTGSRLGGPRWTRAGTPKPPGHYARRWICGAAGVLADLADYAFTRPEAARLEELRLAALEARIDADLALGRHDTLTAELEQLAAEHPLRERLHGQLMLALYRCGRQAEALAAYRRARDLLAGELGIDPGEPLRRLHASVLAQDSALDWGGGRETMAEGYRAGVGLPAPDRRGPRRAAVSRMLGGGRRRAGGCWWLAWRSRSPPLRSSSRWPGRGRAGQRACRATVWA